jgi:hypothetical protein
MKITPKKMIVAKGNYVLYTGNVYPAEKQEAGCIKVKYNETVFIICKEKDLTVVEN